MVGLEEEEGLTKQTVKAWKTRAGGEGGERRRTEGSGWGESDVGLGGSRRHATCHRRPSGVASNVLGELRDK